MNRGEQLQGILEPPVDSEAFDRYADTALNGLIGFLREINTEYDTLPTVRFDTPQETENAALRYFGLPGVSSLLGEISRQTSAFDAIDAVIAKTRHSNKILVPTQKDMGIPLRGEDPTPWEPKRLIPKLKSTLYVLSSEFNIDIEDDQQLILTDGVTETNMVRQESYVAVEVHALDRVILVCDEEGNATFVFDNSALQSISITVEQLTDLDKDELSRLIKDNSKIGMRIIYSRDFADDMAAALRDIHDKQPSAGRQKYYYDPFIYKRTPDAPEGYDTINGFANHLGVSPSAVRAAVEYLQKSDTIGALESYYFPTGTTIGLSHEQQSIIRDQLDRRGLFSPEAPLEVLSSFGMAKYFGVSQQTIKRILEHHDDEVGAPQKYKFRSAIADGYTGDQQVIVSKYLPDWAINRLS